MMSRPRVVSDTFSRADSATSLGVTETGQPWQSLAGPWGISSGEAYTTSVTTNRNICVDVGAADATVTAVVSVVSSTNQGIVLRAVDNSNHYMVRFGTTVVLFRKVAGTYTQIASTATGAVSLANGAVCAVTVTGSEFEISVDNSVVLSHTDIDADAAVLATNTRHGLRLSDTTARFTSFLAVPLGGAAVRDITFDADYATKGLTAYPTIQHRETASVVDDPVLGAARKVLKLTVPDTAIGPTENPRGQLQSPSVLPADADFWFGWATLFPADFPVMPIASSGFLNVFQVHGAPFAGSPSFSIGLRATGDDQFGWHRNNTYNVDHPWLRPLLRNVWFDFAVRMKLSNDPAVGFVELYLNDGTGWTQQLLHGQSRLHFKSWDAAVQGIGPQRTDIQLYRKVGMFASVTVYHAAHKIGASFNAVAPNSHA
jgi:hypothetical protein